MNEVVREFLLETQENLAQLDLDLVTLEKEPTERETLARVFRTFHTVKGTAGFLGLPKLQAITHAGENLLSRLRDGERIFNPDIASTLLAVVDAIRRILTAIEASQDEGDGDYSALIRTIERLTAGGSSVIIPSPQVQAAAPPSKPVTAAAPAPVQTSAPALPVVPAPVPQAVVEPTLITPPPEPVGEVMESRTSAVSDSSLRVDVNLLDKLMTLVGELVLARNQIMQFSTSQEDSSFLNTVQRLNLLTTELQANVMKTRMQPIGNVWSKFPRLVRDLAVACRKKVHLDMDGKETELDRTIIEAIRDPLTHLVRNAIDHGIEPPAERAARGKSAEGRLWLHAFHEGGKVVIEITDDGGGIDPQRVRDKAVRARVLTPEQAARMSDRELLHLIFLPGFSTAETITHFSGRGVGMDVVRTNIEKIGGTVDVDSRVGRGTTVKMKIPLTLAIIPALTITSGGDRYAIPQVSLLELVRLDGEQAQRGIEHFHGAPVYRLRGQLLPLVYLHQELQVESGAANGETNIVVLQADDRRFGLIVDAIHDTEEIVVKPLQQQLKGISAFAGATIMGDGKVALILDVLGLAQHSRVISAVRERALGEKTAAPAESSEDRQTLVLFTTTDGSRMAIPLSQVARLEEFPRSALERVGPQDVVQYHDEILPLIHVSRVLRVKGRKRARPARRRRVRADAGRDGDTVQVIVHTAHGQRVGLVVGQILDIVEEAVVARSPASRRGVLFSAVVQGRVTEFLDTKGIVGTVDPHFFDRPEPVAVEA